MRATRRVAALVTGLFAAACAVAETHDPPGFATCAAYYFLAARGHGMRDYDRQYAAGEHALNEATRRHGKAAAERKMAEVSGVMMREIHQDWHEIARLDTHYGASCGALLRESGHPSE